MADLYCLIDSCRGCGASSAVLKTVLEMDPMPLAGLFCNSEQEALNAPCIPLTWAQCSNCSLMQVVEDVNDTVLFAKYSYASSSVPGLVRHFDEYAQFLAAYYGRESRISVLEVGCNDGILLRRLPSNWRLVGVDPSDVARDAAARDANYSLHNAPFDVALVREVGMSGMCDVVSGSNCLAHSSDMRGMFAAAAEALRPTGHFWLEVHDLQALLQGSQWDTIYHEHKAEWDAGSLTACLRPFGFTPKEAHQRPLHGGLLRICFEKTGSSTTRSSRQIVSSWNRGDALQLLCRAYLERYDSPAARRLAAAIRRGRRISAYGAAGRANVYLNQLKDLNFAFIVDDSPLRANRLLPRVATPVVPRSRLLAEDTAMCLITAWNYRDDIVRSNPDYRGKWLTAFPA